MSSKTSHLNLSRPARPESYAASIQPRGWRACGFADTSESTKTHRSPTDHKIFEQSTTDIWSALSKCCRTILAASKISPGDVKGIGIDATCSLAAVDREGRPVNISRTDPASSDGSAKESDEHLGKVGQGVEWNIILWADHRAEEEADLINSTGEGVLGFVGKTMSVSRDASIT